MRVRRRRRRAKERRVRAPPSAFAFETEPQIVAGTETSTAALTVPGSGRSGLGTAERSGVGVRGAAPPSELESAFAAALLGESNGDGDGVALSSRGLERGGGRWLEREARGAHETRRRQFLNETRVICGMICGITTPRVPRRASRL